MRYVSIAGIHIPTDALVSYIASDDDLLCEIIDLNHERRANGGGDWAGAVRDGLICAPKPTEPRKT